jgi:hypothetical protein
MYRLLPIALSQILRRHRIPAVNQNRPADLKPSDYSLEWLTLSDKTATLGYTENWSRQRGVRTSTRKGETSLLWYDIYLDAPVGIALMHRDRPIAAISFHPLQRKGLFVKQIQGVRPMALNSRRMPIIKNGQIKYINSRELARFDYTSLMLDIAVSLARVLDYSRVVVQSGQNNFWADSEFPLEQARKIYDGIARNAGGRKRRDGNWYISINAFQP